MKNNLNKKAFSFFTMSPLWTLAFLAASQVTFAQDRVFVPSQPRAKAALFVDVHGCLSSPDEHAASSRITDEAEEHGFYVYLPEVSDTKEQKGCFDFYSEDSEFNSEKDAARIIARIHELEKEFDIDSNKIFVMGMSAGASMTSLLTSCYPDIFSGTAIHSGMSYGLAHSWQSALLIAAAGPHVRRTPRRENCAPSDFQGKVFLIHGSRDQIMNPQHYSLLKKDFLEPYSHTKKTVIDPKKYQYPYILENFYDDDHQLKGMGVFVIGMNHEWSGGKPRLPVAPRGPNVTPMIVHFFLNEQ